MEEAMEMEDIYRRYAQTVYKFLLAQCRDADLAEELTAETFYQAVRSIGRYDGSCRLSVWLCQIAKHLWYQHLRKTRRQSETLTEDITLPVPSAEDDVLRRAEHLDLLRAVHTLPERRSVLQGDRCCDGQNRKLVPCDVLPRERAAERSDGT